MLKHLHRLSPHAGGMRTALLGVCHYLHKWKAWAKSCQMQQPKYNLGIHGAAPTMNPILSSPYVAPLKMPGSHCGVLLGQQNQMFYTHSSDFLLQFLTIETLNPQPQTARTEHAWRKGETVMPGGFQKTAPVPKMPYFSASLSFPDTFEDNVHLSKVSK